MEPEQIADVLADTRECIEERGWIRGALLQCGQVCIMGGVVVSQGWMDENRNVQPSKIAAVNEVLYSVWRVLFPEEEPPETISRGWARESLAESTAAVVHWNDQEAPSQQAVLDLLAKTEKTVRAGFDPDAQ